MERILKRKGVASIEAWIEENMSGKSCVVVLIGSETSKRPWVQHEIKKAWKDGKALLGIYIHNLECPNNGKGTKGVNPFDQYNFTLNGNAIKPLVFDPKSHDAYNDISANMTEWIESAITQRHG